MNRTNSFYFLCILNLCVILYASFQPVLTTESISNSDKIAHFSAYATLIALFFLANQQKTQRRIFLIFALTLGLTIEYIQGHMPNRDMSVADVFANVTGCFFGAFVAIKYSQQLKNLAAKILPYFFKS